MQSPRTALTAAALLGAAAITLAGCSDSPAPRSADPTPDARGTRIVLTYDGGLLTLDQDLRVVADDAVEGFTRVNPAGDGRHVLVTVPDGFRVLDTAADPALTDAVFPADTGGHAVVHGDTTALFADGTGDVTVFAHDELDGDTLPAVTTTTSEAAHHGVAIQLEDGTLLTTIGTEAARSGVRALDPDGTELARSEECPDVHGEGAVRDDVAVFGCSDGALVYDDGTFTKIAAPTEYGRTGNLFTTDTSPVAVGDFTDDPDSEGYLLDQIAMIDTASGEYRVADMPEGVGFTFRDLGRGPDDQAVVLGSDGALHTFDETTGEPLDTIDVIDAWDGPTEWQDAHPALRVVGGTAWVTDPAERRVHAVDLRTGEIVASSDELPGVPNEIAVA